MNFFTFFVRVSRLLFFFNTEGLLIAESFLTESVTLYKGALFYYFYLFIYFLNPLFQCSFETHWNICSSGIPSSQDQGTHFLQRARPGTVGKCYCDTEDPDVVVSENRDRDHYNSVVLRCVLWPVALIVLSILALTAAVCFCTNHKEYRRIP